jgi:hypothetical protein
MDFKTSLQMVSEKNGNRSEGSNVIKDSYHLYHLRNVSGRYSNLTPLFVNGYYPDIYSASKVHLLSVTSPQGAIIDTDGALSSAHEARTLGRSKRTGDCEWTGIKTHQYRL